MSSNTIKSSAEQKLSELAIELPRPPTPLGAYVESVRSGNLLFLSGTLPVENGKVAFHGRLGAEIGVEEGRRAAHLATLNALAAARAELGSLDNVTRVIRLAVSVATAPQFEEHPRVADAASELLASVFGDGGMATRMIYGVSSLPLGVSVIVELILEINVG